MAKKSKKILARFEHPQFSNASKTLLANIRFASVDEKVKTIVVTSSEQNEGKTIVSTNLANAIATAGKKVLIVETDMPRRSLGKLLDIHPTSGLYAALSGSASLNDAILPTHIPNLYFLDAEPNIPSPADILSTKRFASLVDKLRDRVQEKGLKTGEQAADALRDIIAEEMTPEAEMDLSGKPAVILVIGVNGVGKTTSIAKLADYYTRQGKRVMLAAGDTFRAAASEQLEIWADRAGVPIVKAGEGADPAAVIFDTVKSATARGYDMVIADTAGRLHNKSNLMAELSKISRSVKKAAPEASLETLLVLDAITGQNAISQAREFCKAADATGIILTKLDGTAKGGCVVAVKQRLGLPVRFIGVGEGIDDLLPFTPEGFVEELLPREWKH